MSEDKKGEKDKEEKTNNKLENIKDIKNDDELQEELKEWEVESTEAGDQVDHQVIHLSFYFFSLLLVFIIYNIITIDNYRLIIS